MTIPFGVTLRLWRLHRELTQAKLARAAGLPRPNLSAIEHGKREVSLSTLRALALALDVRPGALVDGAPPEIVGDVSRFSRESLERIADGAARDTPLRDPAEQALAQRLRLLTVSPRRAGRGRRRATEAAWLSLRAACPPAVLRSLLERVADRTRLDAPPAD